MDDETPSGIAEYAWFADNSVNRRIDGDRLYYVKKHDDYYGYLRSLGARPQQVGVKRANPWGLHDMIGNVWEVTGTRSPFYKDEKYILRGGSFCEGASRECLNSSFRGVWGLNQCSVHVGFRIAANLNIDDDLLQEIKERLLDTQTKYTLPIESGEPLKKTSWESLKKFLHPSLPNHFIEQLDSQRWRETFIKNGKPTRENLRLVARTPSFIELEDTERSVTFRLTSDGFAWFRKGEDGNAWLVISKGIFRP